MRKMLSLFVREQVGKQFLATEQVEPGCEWVINGEGVPTEKIDGSACMVRNGALWVRHEVKIGKKVPDGWAHWDFDPEAKSGHGWRPADRTDPSCAWAFEAFDAGAGWADCTYELVGPKMQGNPYRLERHELWRHGARALVTPSPLSHAALRLFLIDTWCEGIVWHHPDGRMVKLKRRDFGIPWPGDGKAVR